MACKNHTIKVSDETWAAWAAYAKECGLSVTKMLVACVDAHKDGLVQAAKSAGMTIDICAPMPKTVPGQILGVPIPEIPGVKKAIELSEEKPYPFATGKRAPGTPMTATEAGVLPVRAVHPNEPKFVPFTKDQQLKKGASRGGKK